MGGGNREGEMVHGACLSVTCLPAVAAWAERSTANVAQEAVA